MTREQPAPCKVRKVLIGCDHLGLEVKNILRDRMRAQGIEVLDIGVNEDKPVDYPDIGAELARRVRAEEEGEEGRVRGVLVCGTGAGMAIAANKVRGIRAVCLSDPYTAERAIASNNAQVVCFGARITSPYVAGMLLDIYLRNEFGGGGSQQKVDKLVALDA